MAIIFSNTVSFRDKLNLVSTLQVITQIQYAKRRYTTNRYTITVPGMVRDVVEETRLNRNVSNLCTTKIA